MVERDGHEQVQHQEYHDREEQEVPRDRGDRRHLVHRREVRVPQQRAEAAVDGARRARPLLEVEAVDQVAAEAEAQEEDQEDHDIVDEVLRRIPQRAGQLRQLRLRPEDLEYLQGQHDRVREEGKPEVLHPLGHADDGVQRIAPGLVVGLHLLKGGPVRRRAWGHLRHLRGNPRGGEAHEEAAGHDAQADHDGGPVQDGPEGHQRLPAPVLALEQMPDHLHDVHQQQQQDQDGPRNV
mmetsp:Transcript_65322/g.202299  ORF Transcript_65322/g.202299 Transcript_65322/m.202299 type:complete len:237 (+) Transcript_65322:883-1593(+)